MEGVEYAKNELLPEVPSCYDEPDLPRMLRNFKLLCWRASTEQMRDIPTIVIRFCVTIVFALIIGGIYSDIGNSQKSIANRTGLLFLICINQVR